MMALMSGALETCVVCWEHAFLAGQAGLLGFSLCLRPTGHVAAPEPTSAER
jgi:hypothetical protein